MRYSTAFVLGIAGLVSAQTDNSTDSSISGCGEQIDTIIASCLGSTQPQVTACEANAWQCLCDAQQQLTTCYNNCPSDPRAFGASQQLTTWCNAAQTVSSSSSSGSSTGTMTSSSSTSASTSLQSGFAGDDESDSSDDSSDSSAAARSLMPATGLIAAVLGLAAF